MSRDSWDTALKGVGVTEPAQRKRLGEALTMAQQLLQQFEGRIHWAAVEFEEYSPSEQRLPLVIEAPVGSDEESALLEQELAQKVLGPVFMATRISMPVLEILAAAEIDAPAEAERVGLLYPAAA